MSAFNVTAADYAELLEGEDLSPFERSLYENELRRGLKREARHATMDEELRESTLIHQWGLKSLRVARDLLALQWEVAAWDRSKRKPLCYDGTRQRMLSVGRGFAKRVARAQRDARKGNAQQLQWLEDHAELIAAVEGGR